VSSTVDFPSLTEASGAGLPAFLAAPRPRTHAVQFYEKEPFLFDTVGKFLGAGFSAGDRLVVIATRSHTDGFLERIDPRHLERARDEKRITMLDADATLSRFMVGDMPEPGRFRDVLAELMSDAPRDFPVTRVRAYGEMVDMLARQGNVDAAVRLEQLWHDALEENPFSLLCAYLMDNFFRQGDSDRLMEVFASHSHVIPTERFVGVTDPEQRLREIALMQQRTRVLESELKRRHMLERELEDALGDLELVEKQFLASLQRERRAESRAESSDAFKDRVLDILGHDLRNPLNTILTTARMMSRRKELAPENEARLERVLASSMRMQRMIEQLLDVAESRQPDGIQVRLGEARELGPLVASIVSEVRASSPSRTLELVAHPCVARVDAERFEQAVWSLLSYTVAHSGSTSAICVEVAPGEDGASVTVHCDDQIIDPSRLPAMLQSFHLETQPEVGMDGLSLGLYLANRILIAHGGKVEARSSKETGTTLAAILPLA
jgi:signal transduction histidine kinase